MSDVIHADSPGRVAAAIAAVQVVAPDAYRRGVVIYNDSPVDCYLKYGAGATTVDWTLRLGPNEYTTIRDYSGLITGVWGSALGGLQVTVLR